MWPGIPEQILEDKKSESDRKTGVPGTTKQVSTSSDLQSRGESKLVISSW